MNGNGYFQIVLLVAVNFLFDNNPIVNAGVVKRSERMVREIYPPDVDAEIEGNQPPVCIVGDVVYGVGEVVPAEQPCLKCRCQPPGVQCETIRCAKKPGCKAVHRPNECCPDYQCECEHNGKIYGNGEKLETDPEGAECKVCYCSGGKVHCTEFSCYIRNDCEGRRIPGSCCPIFDHCPPIDTIQNRTTSASTTELPQIITLKPDTTDLFQQSNNNNISDTFGINLTDENNKVSDTISELVTVSSGLIENSTIIIKEIIERKEIPITAPPKTSFSEPHGHLLIEEALPTQENTLNDLNIDTESDSSELSEVYQNPPSVFLIGGKIIILKQDGSIPDTTPDNIITVHGAEGLQPGVAADHVEVQEVKIVSEESVNNQELNEPENTTSKEIIDDDLSEAKTNDSIATNFNNDLELKSEESSHILSLVKRKEKTPSSVTTTTTTTTTTTEKEEILTTLRSSIEEPNTDFINKTTSNLNTEETTNKIPSTTLASTELKIQEIIPDQNPAYPPIPDLLPVGEVPAVKAESEEFPDNNSTTVIPMNKILFPEEFELPRNLTQNSSHPEWLKSNNNNNNNESLIDFSAAILPDELLNQKSSIDIDEDNSTSTDRIEDFSTTVVSTDVELISESTEVPQNKSEIEEFTTQQTIKTAESLEMESGEQTTPKSGISATYLSLEKSKPLLESIDMTQGFLKESNLDVTSAELTNASPETMPKDVEIIINKPSTTTKIPRLIEDVELIDPQPTKEKAESSTFELLPTPEEAKSTKPLIIKRSTTDADNVFKDLEKELNNNNNDDFSQSFQTVEEQREEDKKIFKELEEESQGKMPEKSKSTEQEKIENISNALAGITLKGKLPDANVFRLIGGLFGGEPKQ